jgi:urea transporter
VAPLSGAVHPSSLSTAAHALLRVPAQVLFSRSSAVGLLLWAAAATAPRALASGLVAVLAATLLATLLELDPDAIRAGDYGYNALLVGLGVGHVFGLGAPALALLLVGAAASVLITAALRGWLGVSANLPVLSLPFLCVFQLVAPAAAFAGAAQAPLVLEPHGIDGALPDGLELFLKSLGGLFFLPQVGAGALVLAALTVHSRISASLTASAFAAVLLLTSGAAALPEGVTVGGLGYNAMLTAVALGAVFFVPSSASFLLGLLGALVSVLVTLGLSAPFARMGVPLLIVPFNATVLLMLVALRQRIRDLRPKSVDFLSGTPEQNLAYYRTRRTRFAWLHAVSFQLPGRGAWTCTQGVDGAFTHQGAWRHGFDFEVLDDDGRLHRGEGLENDDYHCFRLPVVAAAAGTVVAIESGVADNAVGEVDVERNWGNHVLLHHGVGLYSLVAHLSRGSVKVALGQVVARGDVLGLAGSSGRSPRPHVHFHLQATDVVGAPTLPCRFTDVVLERAAGAASGGAASPVQAGVVPREGDVLRNLRPGDEVDAYLGLELGASATFRTQHGEEHLTVGVDLYGRHVVRSDERPATLFYGRGDAFFTAYDAVGDDASVLHLLRAALPRLPLELNPALTWTDHLPARRYRPWLGRVLVDVLSPFLPRDGIEMRMRVRREGARLVVEGTSARRDARGRAIVQTSAELARGVGVVRVTVIVRGRAASAERVDRAELGVNQEHRVPAAGLVREKTRTEERMKTGTNMKRWISVGLAVVVLGCGVASAVAEGGAADQFQRSYESEASGKTGDALAAIDGLPAPQRDGYVAQLRRGWLLYKLGKSAESIDAYGKAVALEPRSIEARVGALLPAMALRRWADTETGAREVLKLDPGNYLANLRLAFSIYNLGRYPEAAALYKRLAEAYPSDVEVRGGLGWALLKQGKANDATAEFRAVLEIAPRNALAADGLKAAMAVR